MIPIDDGGSGTVKPNATGHENAVMTPRDRQQLQEATSGGSMQEMRTLSGDIA